MERAIYRAKRKDNGEWIQGYPFCFWGKAYICWGMSNDSPDMIEVDMDTMSQFTGLYDKIGQEIFEDDILAYSDAKLGHVNYHFGCFCVKEPEPSKNNIAIDIIMTENYVEVLGNVYDNPEMIEGK